MQIDKEVLHILNEDLQFATISDALCTEIVNIFKAKYAHLTGSMAPKVKVEVDNDHIYCEFQVAIDGGVALVYDEGNQFKIISEIDPAGIIEFPKDFDNDLEIVKFVNKSETIKTLVDSIFNVILEANEEFDNLKELYGANESKNESVTLDQVEVGDVVRFDGKDGYEYPGKVVRIDKDFVFPIRVEVTGFQKSITPEEVIKVTKPDSKLEGLDNGQILLQDLIELAKSNDIPLNSAILIPSKSGRRALASNAKIVHFTGNNYGIELQQ